MRDIKFRAWYKNNWEFETPQKVEYLTFDELCDSGSRDNGDFEWMQYTGLKDKNAYEGDIIRDNIGIGVIEYVDKYAAFRVNYINDRCKWFYDYLDSEMETLEVIGNIYEHSDLLEE